MIDNKKPFIVDEELHNLLVTLIDTKKTYADLCKRIRSQGIELDLCLEKDYNVCLRDLISEPSNIVFELIYHNIRKEVKNGK